jgi:putative flippase GtrA
VSQFVRFLLVGIFNTVFGFAVIFACMYLAKLGPLLSNVIGYGCGLVTSYALNKWFTFRSTARGAAEPLRFLLVFGISYLLNLAALLVLVRHLAVHEGLAQLVAGVVYVSASYLLNRYFVFRQAHAA